MKIFVKAKPNAKKEGVTKTGDARFVVAVKELAKEGMANEAVMRALAEYFGIAPSKIRIISGHASRNKVLGL